MCTSKTQQFLTGQKEVVTKYVCNPPLPKGLGRVTKIRGTQEKHKFYIYFSAW